MISEWSQPNEVLKLSPDTVHVWLLKLEANLIHKVHAWLSTPELERAAAFRFSVHRNEFVISRGALRFLLGSYLRASPSSIDIRSAVQGKPCLSDECGDGLQFNVSHSGEFALFAFTIGREIGIDLEKHNASAIDDGMLRQCLTGAERTRYMNAAPESRVAFFFDTWARKEAYMKLTGDGMNIAPTDLSLSSADTAREVIRGDEIYFEPINVEGYSAALAMTDRARVEFYRLGSNLLP
jgi:4'-phosphopantetheinyl transferase